MQSMMATLTMLALAGAAHGGTMKGVHEQVQVASAGARVVLTLTLDNGAAAPVYVPRSLYQASQLFGRAFEIAQDGAALDYIGPMVKRGPLGKDDFLKVAPGAKLVHSIDITASYAFTPGSHAYVLTYGGMVLADPGRPGATVAPPPSAVRFTYRAK